MCSTCGCGNSDGEILIATPEENAVHQHHDAGHHHHDAGHHHHDAGHHHSNIGSRTIELEQDILLNNNLLAERNRGYFEAKNIKSFNFVSSPGSGKTTILERTIKELKDFPIYVIEGDQQTFNDAERIREAGAPVIQINTGKACHLDADMINKAIKKLQPEINSYLFIENVGNLVCPALFDLGETKRVVIMSITEGDDKPIKYPNMFETAHLCIINKIDLLPYLESDIAKIKEYALRVNHHIEFIELSAKTGEGMKEWYEYMKRI